MSIDSHHRHLYRADVPIGSPPWGGHLAFDAGSEGKLGARLGALWRYSWGRLGVSLTVVVTDMVKTLDNETEPAQPTSGIGGEGKMWAMLGRLSVAVTVLGAAAWVVLGALEPAMTTVSGQVAGTVAVACSPVAFLIATVTLIGTSVRHTRAGRAPAWVALGVNGVAMIVGFLTILILISSAFQSDITP